MKKIMNTIKEITNGIINKVHYFMIASLILLIIPIIIYFTMGITLKWLINLAIGASIFTVINFICFIAIIVKDWIVANNEN